MNGAGLGRTVGVMKPLGTNTRVFDRQEMRQDRHLVTSHAEVWDTGAEAQGYQGGSFLLLFCTPVTSQSTCLRVLKLPPALPSDDSVPDRQGVGSKGALQCLGRKFPHKSLHPVSLGSHGELGEPDPQPCTDSRNQAP